MDHKVSKDMISSGMTPSGEKTQADLGRTQYGSAPSPSKLMNAYESMYQDQKQENLDEKIDPYNFKRSKRTLQQKQDARKTTQIVKGDKSFDVPTGEPASPNTASLANTMRGQGTGAKQKLDKTETTKTTKKDNNTQSKGFGESSADLLAAYYAVYEHHKKDEDGNTIPHEDDVKEGKIPAGLQAYLDKKKGKKEDKKEVKEDFDLFDVISDKLIEEGYSKKESYEIMANLTDEQLEEINEAIVTGTLATLGVLGKLLAGGAAKAAVAGKGLAAAAKGGAMAAKGLAKGAVKGAVSAGKNVVSGTQNIANKALTKVQSIAKSPNKGPKITQSGGDVVQGSDKSKESPLEKLEKNYYRYQMAKSLLPQGSSGSTSVNKTGTVSASADLFDIVKGQLLDEGLSEEEIRDIMLELTPEEILNEITGNLAMKASRAADMKRAELAKAGDRAGAADKAAQASRLYKKGAERNLAKQDLSKPLNPQPTNYPKGKGASYQEKPGM